MPVTVKYDLLQSTQTLGVQDYRADRAVRRWYAEGITNTTLGIGEAIEFIRNDPSVAFHQSNLSLPIWTIHGERYGPESARGYIYYAHRGFSTLNQFGHSIADFETANWSVDWFRMPMTASGAPDPAGAGAFFPGSPGGAPNGAIRFNDGTFADTVGDSEILPRAWTWIQSGVRVYVPRTLTFNPLFNTAPLQDHINNNTFSIGSMTFAPYTLLYEGIRAKWSVTSAGSLPTWSAIYTFLHMPRGFLSQNAHFDESQFGGVWVTTTSISHPAAQFTVGSFP